MSKPFVFEQVGNCSVISADGRKLRAGFYVAYPDKSVSVTHSSLPQVTSWARYYRDTGQVHPHSTREYADAWFEAQLKGNLSQFKTEHPAPQGYDETWKGEA